MIAKYAAENANTARRRLMPAPLSRKEECQTDFLRGNPQTSMSAPGRGISVSSQPQPVQFFFCRTSNQTARLMMSPLMISW